MPVSSAQHVAQSIALEMSRQGRTQTALAGHLRRHQTYVNRRMRGHVEWSAGEVMEIAAWLGIPVSRLYGEAVA